MKIGNRTELYHETVEVLYDAYFKDELKHGNCKACAVGNICKKASSLTGIMNEEWNVFFCTSRRGDHYEQRRSFHRTGLLFEDAKKLISNTGYRIIELADIEFAFESADKGDSDEDWMFNGLAAVLKVLKQIHEVQDDEVTLTRFESHYNSKKCTTPS